jgi:hypothetical protein
VNEVQAQVHPRAAASPAHLALALKSELALLPTYLQLPFYNRAVNLVWCGLSTGLLLSVGLLAAIMFGQDKGAVDPEVMTWVSTATAAEPSFATVCMTQHPPSHACNLHASAALLVAMLDLHTKLL